MRLIALLLPCLLSAQAASAQALKPFEELPLPPHQPIAKTVTERLAAPLMFSSSQTRRVERALSSEVDEKANRLVRQYSMLSAEMRQKRYELRELIYNLYLVRNRLTASARAVMSPEKKEIFDPLVYEGKFLIPSPHLAVVPQPEQQDEVVETTTTLPDGRVVRKKIIIRRKRKEETRPGFMDSGEDSPAAELHFETLMYPTQP